MTDDDLWNPPHRGITVAMDMERLMDDSAAAAAAAAPAAGVSAKVPKGSIRSFFYNTVFEYVLQYANVQSLKGWKYSETMAMQMKEKMNDAAVCFDFIAAKEFKII